MFAVFTGINCAWSCLQSSAAATDMGNEAGEQASVILDSICELYHNGIVQYMDGQRYEKLRYDMLISSLDGALPKQHAAVVRNSTRACDANSQWQVLLTGIRALNACSRCPYDKHCA